jgi:hypothetical protein
MTTPTDAAVTLPMDKGPWVVDHDGRTIYSEDFAADVTLVINGDFMDAHHRKDYAVWLARTLNEATRSPAREGGDVSCEFELISGMRYPDEIMRCLRDGQPGDVFRFTRIRKADAAMDSLSGRD